MIFFLSFFLSCLLVAFLIFFLSSCLSFFLPFFLSFFLAFVRSFCLSFSITHVRVICRPVTTLTIKNHYGHIKSNVNNQHKSPRIVWWFVWNHHKLSDGRMKSSYIDCLKRCVKLLQFAWWPVWNKHRLSNGKSKNKIIIVCPMAGLKSSQTAWWGVWNHHSLSDDWCYIIINCLMTGLLQVVWWLCYHHRQLDVGCEIINRLSDDRSEISTVYLIMSLKLS